MVANELETRGSVMGQDRVRFPPLPLLNGRFWRKWRRWTRRGRFKIYYEDTT